MLAAGALALTGCGAFFTKETSSGGGGGGGSTSNLVYTMNSVSSTVSGFSVGTGTLTTVPNMPYGIGFVPQAAVVTIPNTYLYVTNQGAIYAYAIGSDGSLPIPVPTNTGQALANEVSLDVSPDGKWLFGLNGTTSQLDIFSINASTGGLTLSSTVSYTVTGGLWRPKMVKVSATGTYVFAALGTGGDVVFTFNTNTGTGALVQTINPISNQTSDNALAVDSTVSHLYIARTGVGLGLAVYSIGAAGLPTALSGSPFAAGGQPLGVVLDSTGTHVYVANGSDATISGYSLSNGVPTALSGSPYASGANVQSLTLDRSGTYLLAAAPGGSADLTMYSFDATTLGKLNQVATAATGTDPAGAFLVVASH